MFLLPALVDWYLWSHFIILAPFLPCTYQLSFMSFNDVLIEQIKTIKRPPLHPGMFWLPGQHLRPLGQKDIIPYFKNNNNAGIHSHSTFTFLGRLLCRVQLFAAEVTLRKHSCFSGIWCHHRTTRPVLIFNKDETFISQSQTVRAWQLQVHEEEINSADCFSLWFTVLLLSARLCG